MTQPGTVTNPLGLPVEYRDGITPLHEAHDTGRLAELTASMERDGWAGAPIVADRELRESGQDKAYTGSHRLAAWAGVHEYEPVPCVYIEDLCDALGIDWDALMDGHGNDAYEAATDLCYQLPDDVREAYGLDVGGAA